MPAKGQRDPLAKRTIRSQRYNDEEDRLLLEAAGGREEAVQQIIRAAALSVATICPPGARYIGVHPCTGLVQFFECRSQVPSGMEVRDLWG